jgi:hypothetical protein
MTSKFSAFFSVSALIIAIAVSAPATARDNNIPMGGPKTKTELKADGYECAMVTPGFDECTKKDSPTYWCSGETCQQKRAQFNPRNQLPNIERDNHLLER